MKNYIKHLFMLCLFGMISIGAMAEVVGGPCGDNATWSLDTETWKLTISGSGEMTNYDNFGKNVPWYEYRSSILSVEIGDQITSVGNYAFYGYNMTNVILPNSITKIGNYAFYDCDGLTNVALGENVTTIGDDAFSQCSYLTDINIPNKVTQIGAGAFWQCKIKTVSIPASVTRIGNQAFGGYYLEEVVFEDSPNEIVLGRGSTSGSGRGLFGSCSSLKKAYIGRNIGYMYFTYDDNYAFHSLESIQEVVFGNLVTKSFNLLYKCNGLKKVVVPWSEPIDNSSFFYVCTLTGAVLQVPVGSKDLYASDSNWNRFSNIITEEDCPSGTCGSDAYWSLNIANGTLDIYGSGEVVDYSTENVQWQPYLMYIKRVNIGSGITTMRGSWFYSNPLGKACPYLESVSVPNSMKAMYVNFSGCGNLTNVYISDLDRWAEMDFCGDNDSYAYNILRYAKFLILNDEIVSDIILKDATKIGNSAFSGYNAKNIILPNTIQTIGMRAFEGCSGLTSIEIPNSVTEIGNLAFSNCSGLKSVTIPNSVTMIGDAAFSYCSGLTSVTIPNSVTSIGSSAFSNCSGLTSVAIPNSVTSIGEWAFWSCTGLTSVTIGNSVTSIGERAFSSCSGLTSVTIPNSVTSIGYNAFYGCSGLKNIIADGINAPTTYYSFGNVESCSLHVPLGSEGAYATNFGTYFKSGNTYGNTIVPYSTYSKNSAGEYSFEVWDASSDVVLGEGIEKVYVPVEATVNDLQYKRTFNNTDWQALYVPFELDVENDLADFSVYEISTSSADAINVTLMTEGKTSANTPYLMKAKATGEQAIPVSSKKVEVTVENTNSELSDFEIVGTYAKLKYGDISGDWYALKGGKFMKAGEGAYLNPYRFYLKRKASSAKESIDININEPTGITLYENPSHRQAQGKLGSGQAQNENGVIYNLNGMRVDSNYKGIVIINGKKYLKK